MSKRRSLTIGDVVRDRFGREGVVCSLESQPSEKWIREQVAFEDTRERIRELGAAARWLGIMPFGGGYSLSPEVELEWLRGVTYEDFLSLGDTAGEVGREKLVKLFPEFAGRLVRERGDGRR